MRPNVLYICTDNEVFAGSSKSLLNMLYGLRDYVTPIVLFSQDGLTPQVFRNANIETWIHPFTYVWQESEHNLFNLLRHPKRHILYQWHNTDSKCVKFVIEKLSGRRLALVHSNTSVVTIGATISKTLNVPHVWHIREFQDKDFNISPFMGKAWLKHLIRRSDAQIYISHAVKEHWNINAPNSYVIRNVIVNNDKPTITTPKQKYFLYCAAQVRESKGASLAVQAFCRTGLSKLGYSLILLGICDDEYRKKLIKLAEENNTPPSCLKFLGYQRDVSYFFSEASAFLMCSICEGLGRVTIEAMYYGCPVIAFASGGTLEIVTDNQTGHLFYDDNELVKKMKEIVQKDQLPLLKKAQDYAVNNYTAESIIPSIITIYNNLLH